MEVEARTDPRGLTYYWVGFRRGERDQGPESDIEALNAGHIVVTPLRYDRTDEDGLCGAGAVSAALEPGAEGSRHASEMALHKDLVRRIGQPHPLPVQKVAAEHEVGVLQPQRGRP